MSHWEVDSQATVALMTRLFAELKADPKIGRAEALRRAMRWLLADGSLPDAHPSAWGPFVLVGKGSAPCRAQNPASRARTRQHAHTGTRW